MLCRVDKVVRKYIQLCPLLLTMSHYVSITPCLCLGDTILDQQKGTISSAENQVRSLLQDRPQLQPIVQEEGPIWNWLVSAFGDKSINFQIRWDNRPTSENNPERAQSTAYPDRNNISYIRVNRTYKSGPLAEKELSSEEVLSGVVFELNNVLHADEVLKIKALAASGSISREEFIISSARLEYSAEIKTSIFYSTIWIPFCNSKGINCTPKLWHMPVETTFDQWLLRYPRHCWYPWKYYGDIYDQIKVKSNNKITDSK